MLKRWMFCACCCGMVAGAAVPGWAAVALPVKSGPAGVQCRSQCTTDATACCLPAEEASAKTAGHTVVAATPASPAAAARASDCATACEAACRGAIRQACGDRCDEACIAECATKCAQLCAQTCGDSRARAMTCSIAAGDQGCETFCRTAMRAACGSSCDEACIEQCAAACAQNCGASCNAQRTGCRPAACGGVAFASLKPACGSGAGCAPMQARHSTKCAASRSSCDIEGATPLNRRAATLTCGPSDVARGSDCGTPTRCGAIRWRRSCDALPAITSACHTRALSSGLCSPCCATATASRIVSCGLSVPTGPSCGHASRDCVAVSAEGRTTCRTTAACNAESNCAPTQSPCCPGSASACR